MLAIDFGSVNTAAAWASEGRIEKVRLEPSSETMPSAVVWVDERWRVGQAALNARRANPQTFVATPKARLGYEPTLLGSGLVRASTMVSQVFAVVRDRAVAVAGGTGPDRVILTHPEHWGQKRQAALLKAARLAGFPNEITTLLPEPVAAVRANTEPSSLSLGSRVAVVDIGGGTCDVAVLEVVPDGLMVVAREGDERLGGNDFDDLLYRWLLDQLESSGHGDMVKILADPAHIGAALTVLESVRLAKQDLSFHPDAQIAVSVAADNETVMTVTRDEYEEIIDEPLRRVAALTRSALASSGTTTLDHLFLTGGSAHTPAVARALHEVTGILSAPLGDPKMATVTGALRTVLHDAPPPALSVRSSDPPLPPASRVLLAPTVAAKSPDGPPTAATGLAGPSDGRLDPTPQADPPDLTVQADPVDPDLAPQNPPGAPPNPVPPSLVLDANPSRGARRRHMVILATTIGVVVALALGGLWGAKAWSSARNDPTSPSTVALPADGTAVVGPDGSPLENPPDGAQQGGGSVPGSLPDASSVPELGSGTDLGDQPPTTSPATASPQTPATKTPTASTPTTTNTPTTNPGKPSVALTVGGASSVVRECDGGGWSAGTATVAGAQYGSAMTCKMYANEKRPGLEYLTNGATTLTATVGLDDTSPKSTASVTFAVVDVVSGATLGQRTVKYGTSATMSVNVSGSIRIRLEALASTDTGSKAVWASAKLSF
ncbi:MAG: Hsp70 family protein [Micrococcales bacterium]|nr:Hsp70 family protein [Micrococcales bacterium]